MSAVAPLPSTSPSSSQIAGSIDGFVDAMDAYLSSNPFEKLSAFFHLNHPIYSPDPLWGKSFDLLLVRSFQKTDQKDADWERTLQLAQLIEPACPEWAKIAQSICFFQLKKKSEGSAIVEKMVASDASEKNTPSHLIELIRRQWQFDSENDPRLASAVTALIQNYDAKSKPPIPKSNLIPLYYIRA
jgi:hypothetical protein